MHIDVVKLSKEKPTIGPGSKIKATTFGQYVELGAQNYIDNATIGDYTYTGQYCFIQNSTLKRFISMAAMIRIGPTNHPTIGQLNTCLLTMGRGTDLVPPILPF